MNKNKVNYLLNEYLETHGKIDLQLPDGVDLEIDITQESKRGPQRDGNYCCITAQRDDRTTILDRYSLSAHFTDSSRTILTEQADGEVMII